MKKCRNKHWHDKRSRKLNLSKYRRRKCHHNNGTLKNDNRIGLRQRAGINKNVRKIEKAVPQIFSFLHNREETARFFKEVVEDIKKSTTPTAYFINADQVEDVTVEALIYLIVIARNIVVSKCTLYGNLPGEKYAQKIFVESGFLNHFKSNIKIKHRNTDKLLIHSGNNADSTLTKEICDFAQQKLNRTRKDTIGIQRILIELMLNVVQHAYTASGIMGRNWFIYAEYIEDKIRIFFVDTGQGIAKTVYKKFYEKLVNNIGLLKQSDLVKSAFEGEFRTETGEPNRGNGLAEIRRIVKENIVENFVVISGKAYCEINSADIVCHEMKNGIYGTMFVFDYI